MLKTQQRFRSEKRNVFAEEINKIVHKRSIDHQRMQTVDLIETYAHRMKKDLISKKQKN